MQSQMQAIPCTIMRGGTSKGIFIRRNDLPPDPELRDSMIRKIFGSPDIRQIDGLGGADVLTSKLAIIGPSKDREADVEYTFAQVSFETDTIDYAGNCGNISSAVGPYAIDAGLVEPVEPVTTVRVRLTNSGQILTEKVPVFQGKASVCGDFSIDGVPGTGAKITMDWSGVVGSVTGKLLPTGNAVDVLETGGRRYPVSLVDAGNPLVFIHASTLGLNGTEQVQEIEGNRELMETIERIRAEAAVKFGLVEQPERAAEESPYIPFFAIVSEPAAYKTLNGKSIAPDDMDLTARLLFMHKMHKAYPITGTVCTGAAARIPGSIVHQIVRDTGRTLLRIGHPSGVVEVDSAAREAGGTVQMTKIETYRTARRIMDGLVYIKNDN
ncbi:MAG: 3-methylitaconate isomerase [Lachnospiraceae bacterium]|nr:3-methylitaconate isomerase [Lachnospiraceae bacterium]